MCLYVCMYLQTQGYVLCYYYSSSVTNLQNLDRINLKSEIMDGFWCSRCLNDRLKVYFWMLLLKRGLKAPAGPEGPPVLRRSEKEDGHRPPKPSRY